MKYYYLEPEVAGQIGPRSALDTSVHPPRVSRLHYEFYGWLGDDLLESFPCYIITERLENKLNDTGATGYALGPVEVTKSEFYKDMYPDAPALPRFYWLKVKGEPGVDDFGYSKDYRLVVSEPVLGLLQSLNLAHCEIEEFRIGRAGL